MQDVQALEESTKKSFPTHALEENYFKYEIALNNFDNDFCLLNFNLNKKLNVIKFFIFKNIYTLEIKYISKHQHLKNVALLDIILVLYQERY